jgi:hypothetical protein
MAAEGGAWLGEADGGGRMKPRARGDASRARPTLRRDEMEAAWLGPLVL